MAVAEIIGAAVGVLLLVAVAYILVGTTLSTAELVVSAQNDLTLQNEQRLRTDLVISEKMIDGNAINFSVINTGNEIISNFQHVDVYSYVTGDTGYQYYRYDKYATGDDGNWTITRFENDYLHPKSLDPGETMWCLANFSGTNPIWIQIATANGVSASAYLT
jgi:flagellar protein FlaF